MLLLFSNIAFAQAPTLPAGVQLPDNIVVADCVGTPAPSVWSFKELARSTQAVTTLGIALAGDVDNDGKVEVVAASAVSGPYAASPILYIFDDQLSVKYTITLQSGTSAISNSYSIADVDGDGYAEIYVCAVDGYLYKYSHNKQAYNGANFVYERRVQHTTNARYFYVQPMITDFNGDGFPEVVVLDKIYDANTLQLLVDGNRRGSGDLGYGAGHVATSGSSSNHPTSIMAIGDVDGDDLPELIAGSTVYKITINNRTSTASNSFTVYSQANTIGRSEVGDGATAIADMDGDGKLDVVVARRIGTNRAAIYIWNPRTGNIMNSNTINDLYICPIYSTSGPFGPSLPFIGDIDGDGKPEVVVVSHRNGVHVPISGGMVTAYDFDSGQLIKKTTGNWPLVTTDYSAATAITLFDFNQDGNFELVYRDCNHLRILDGTTATDLVTPLVVCGSPTGQEYPIVVDFNNDGSAEIIVTGHPTIVSDGATNGYLRAFGSNGTKWAPARKVWNQYAYNSVNINEDLTVPRKQMNPATRFSGNDGILNNGDDIYPFNGYLMQQTILNQYGEPLWLIPNGEIIGDPTFFYNDITDHLSITIQVKNIGTAAFQNPFYLTIYKNNMGNAIKHVHKHEAIIAKDEMVSITIEISNYYATFGAGKLVINLNDKGDGSIEQPACGTCSEESYFGFAEIEECIKKPKTLTNDVSLPGTVTYQWQSSADAKIWTNIAGATNSSYIVPNQKTGTSYYKVVADNGSVTMDGALTKMIIYRCIMPVNPNIHIFK